MYLYSYSKLTSLKCPEYINKWKSLWDGCRTSQGCFPRTQHYKAANFSVFQIENNTLKMHLYEMFKIDALGTPQWRLLMGVFSGLFEDVHKMVFQYSENISN